MEVQDYPKVEISFSPIIPPLKRLEDKTKINIRYALIAPFALAHIYWNSKISELVYEVEEPLLTRDEEKYKEELRTAMENIINVGSIVGKEEEVLLDYIDRMLRILITELGIDLTIEGYQKVYYYLCRDFIGFNEVEPLLRDYFIEDIECNGVDTPVYIVHRLYRNIKTNIIFKDADALANLVEKMAQRTGKYISYANPILDGSLDDGSRVNATYTKDISSRGPTFCFKDGYVQLSDGRVKNIKELFEECKKNFGSKIEEENEIVEVANMNCCGVEENLQQKDSRIKSIIKIKAPEKLAKIDFEDGGEVEVTLDHKFHVADDSLSLIEAKDLREGMMVPIPKKIEVEGYRQKIDVYSILKDFSYHKKISVISTPAIKNLVYNEIQNTSGAGRMGQALSQKYGLGNTYFYEIMQRGNSISFAVLDELCKNRSSNFSSLGEIAVSVYGGGTKNKSKAMKVPTIIDENLSYLAGALTSDGHLSKEYVDFSCYEEGFKKSIKEKLSKIFGKYESYYDDNRVYLCNVFAPFFFNRVFGIPIGNKSRIVEVPEAIFKSDNKIISAFVRGLFDGDGTVSAGLSYKTYSKKLAEGLTYLLARLGIFSYLRKAGAGYRINIPSPYYSLYSDLIGFDCISKKEGLKKLIEKQVSHKAFIRHDRIPGAPILSIIKKLGIQKTKIVENCGVNFNRFLYSSFSREFARALIKEIREHKDFSKVEQETRNVENMLDANQEFVKIKKVEIVENADPVYDIELEPCMFYVAGNKPMNMFDTIRKFTKTPWTPTQLVSFNTLSPEMAAYLWLLIEHKMNILITGGTSSGKTSLLNAIAFFIVPEARVVSIEDSVTGDSKIIIKENEKISNVTIKEFVDNKINAEIMTLDEKGKIVWIKPSSYIKHKVKKDIYEIITSTGRKINVTQDHSLFSLGENNELKDIKPTELIEGKSLIAVPRNLPIKGQKIEEMNLMEHLEVFKDDFLQGEPIRDLLSKYSYKKLGIEKEKFRWWKNHNLMGIGEFLKLKTDFSLDEIKKLKIKSKNASSIPAIFEISDEFLEFCGLWLGDGSYDNYNKNSVILSNVDKECIEVFKKIANHLGSNYSAMSDGGVSLRIHSTIFYKFMKYVLKFDGYSNTKKIPAFVFGLSNDQLKHFIMGYFSADGCIKKNEVSCASQSYELLEDLQSMLLRFGIISRLNDFKRKDKCINMSISSFENIEKFKEIGFLQERKKSRLNSYNLKATHASSDVIPLSLKKLAALKAISKEKLESRYLSGLSLMGRNYMQRIAPAGSEFNDISHTDILWDKVKSIRKVSSSETEVFDLSIPKYEKFLCNNIFVHNTRELSLPRENWLPSVAREATGIGGIGEIDLFTLLRSSFRQNPDYVIVGEVRGKEASVLFQGMASGHSSISTMHADSVDTVIKRLETPPIELSPTLLNVLDCVCIMTHAIVKKQETRKLKEIVEIINVNPDGIALTNTPFFWNPSDDNFYFKKNSKIFEKISKKSGIKTEELELEFRRRSQLVYKLYQSKVFGFREIHDIINEYYKKPEETLKKFSVQ